MQITQQDTRFQGYFGLDALSNFIRWLEGLISIVEELVSVLSGPLLAIGLSFSLVDFLMQGSLLKDTHIALAWSIVQAAAVDAQLVLMWHKSKIAQREHNILAFLGFVALGIALAFVAFGAVALQSLQQSAGMNSHEALRSLGLTAEELVYARSGVAIVLACVAGWTRSVAVSRPTVQPVRKMKCAAQTVVQSVIVPIVLAPTLTATFNEIWEDIEPISESEIPTSPSLALLNLAVNAAVSEVIYPPFEQCDFPIIDAAKTPFLNTIEEAFLSFIEHGLTTEKAPIVNALSVAENSFSEDEFEIQNSEISGSESNAQTEISEEVNYFGKGDYTEEQKGFLAKLSDEGWSVLNSYPNVECWLSTGQKTASLEEIMQVTNHSKRMLQNRIKDGTLKRSPRNTHLIVISSVIEWLKTAPMPTQNIDETENKLSLKLVSK